MSNEGNKYAAKYNENTIWRVVILLMQGVGQKSIAKEIGVSPSAICHWKTHNKTFRKAWKTARSERRRICPKKSITKPSWTLDNWISEQLDDELKVVWKALQGIYEAGNSMYQIEQVLENVPTTERQLLFLYAFYHYHFNLSKALAACNIKRDTFAAWKENPQFHTIWKLFHKEIKGDMFESSLIKAIQEGDTRAITFANKTFNKETYGERIDISMTGHIATLNRGIDIDALDLSLACRKEILEAVRLNNAKTAESRPAAPGRRENGALYAGLDIYPDNRGR